MLSFDNVVLVAHSAMNSNKKTYNCRKGIALIDAVYSIFIRQLHAGGLIRDEQE